MAEETAEVPSLTSQQASDGKKSQAQVSSQFKGYPNGDFPMYPVYYPALVHGLNPVQYEEQMNRGAGIYAVPLHPFAGHVATLASNNLIPLTYNVPTSGPSDEAETGGVDQGQDGGQQMGQPANQRQVVERRFQIAFQLDIFLILKLAAVVFLFNQDGSKQRLAILVFFATMIYLYQTGALQPFIRWLSGFMQRAAAPPRPQRPIAGQDNDPAAAGLLHGEAVPEQQDRGENEARQADNENIVDPEAGNQWWGIVKEIQMIVFGFITSLFPGFHNID